MTAAGFDLLVVFKLSSAIAWLDPDDLSLRHTIQLPTHPHEVLVDEPRRRAYISIYGDGIYGNNTRADTRVAVIDLDTHRLITMVELGANHGPHGLAAGPDGTIWVACDRSASVVAIDPDAMTALSTVRLDDWATPHWLVSTSDGRKGFTSNKATDHLSVVDLAERRVEATIDTPTGAEGLDLSSDDTTLYVADHSGAGLADSSTAQPRLHVIDVATQTISASVPLPLQDLGPGANHELRVRVTPDDRHILVSGNNWSKVLILEAENLGNRTILDVDGGPMGFGFPPDYATTGRCEVALHNAGTLGTIDVPNGRLLTAQTPSDVLHEGPETLQYVRRA